MACWVKSISHRLSWASKAVRASIELYADFYSLIDYSTFLQGFKLTKFRYLRNFGSKGCIPLFCPGVSNIQGQWIHKDTCDTNIKNHWSMSLFSISNGNKLETPNTVLSILVDICKTSENGFTQYSVF
jgi:hypothetical protein